MTNRKPQRDAAPRRGTSIDVTGAQEQKEIGGREQLTGKLVQRLRERGLPLEMRVARTLRTHGFVVTPSLYVQVPGGRRPREIDARAVLTRLMMSVQMSFELYVECKWSQDKPWVVYSSKEATPPPAVALQSVLVNPMGETLLWLCLESPDLLDRPPFFSNVTGAHGGVRVNLGEKGGGSGPDMFYRTMQSVTAIAHAGVGYRDSATTMVDHTRDATFAFAVVVIDGPLFEAYLEEGSDAFAVRPIEHARVFWRGARAGDITAVDVVTVDALDAFAVDCIRGIEAASNDYLLMAHSDVLQALAKDDLEPLRIRLHGRSLGVPITYPTVIRGLVTRLANERSEPSHE